MGRENAKAEGGQAHRTQKHATHATQLRTVCLLVAGCWDGMGWDGIVWPATIIL
jgi:hypothetical protein